MCSFNLLPLHSPSSPSLTKSRQELKTGTRRQELIPRTNTAYCHAFQAWSSCYPNTPGSPVHAWPHTMGKTHLHQSLLEKISDRLDHITTWWDIFSTDFPSALLYQIDKILTRTVCKLLIYQIDVSCPYTIPYLFKNIILFILWSFHIVFLSTTTSLTQLSPGISSFAYPPNLLR